MEAGDTVANGHEPTGVSVRIVLVDDHAVVRQGTREMLNRHSGFEVVGECASEEGLTGLLRLKNPDVLLLDINLPGRNGLQILEDLRPEFPELKVILFTAHTDLQYIRKARSLQADGYLGKTAGEEELRDAILRVVKGEVIFSREVRERLRQAEQSNHQNRLTAREHEILALLAQGLTNQAIAKNLCLSVKTVDTHVANLIKKTAVANRTQLLAHAYEQGLL